MNKETRIQRPYLAPGATALLFAAVAVLGWVSPSYTTGLLIDCLIFSIFAVGLNLLLGYTGLPSLGHAAYFGVGAYTAGLMMVHVTNNFWWCALAAIAVSLVFGVIYGFLSLRTSGVFFLIITLALGQITWAIAFSWRSLTGGDDGLRGIGRPDLGFGLSLQDNNHYFILALAALALTLYLTRLIVRSPFGAALRGSSLNPERMAALGYNVWLCRFLGFVISAGISGFAGVIFVFYKGFVSPEAVSIVVSAEVMLMVIVGGTGTLLGPVLGAFIVVYLGHAASSYTDRWMTILGVLYILVVLFAPHGIIRALGRPWKTGKST